MLTKWQFNILFFVGVGGAILMLIGPEIGLDIGKNPNAVLGVGAILTYVLSQKKSLTKPHDKTDENEKTEDKKEGETDEPRG